MYTWSIWEYFLKEATWGPKVLGKQGLYHWWLYQPPIPRLILIITTSHPKSVAQTIIIHSDPCDHRTLISLGFTGLGSKVHIGIKDSHHWCTLAGQLGLVPMAIAR